MLCLSSRKTGTKEAQTRGGGGGGGGGGRRRLSCPMLLLLLLSITMALQLPLHACHSATGATVPDLHPIVLIPGSGGNQLEARLTRDYKPSSLLCRLLDGKKSKDGWFRLWFDPTVLIAPLTRCFAERMTLHYHADLDDYRNAPGVDTRVPYFGSTQGLLYLDPHLKHITEYMATLVSTLKEMGYKDGLNLFGAPYDFRYGLAADGHPSKVGTQYLNDLTDLIESATASNGGHPAILLSHSLGGLFAHRLLARSTPAWRRRHVRHFIALSTPWGGTVQEMVTFASGYTLGIPVVDPLLVRGEQRSSESNLWLLPSPEVFGDRPLVVTPERSYSALEMTEFLQAIGFEEGVGPYKARTLPLVRGRVEEPGVPVTCVVGSGVETPEKLVYGGGGYDEQPEVVYGDGDGTVNLESLLRVETEWAESKGQELRVVRVPGVSHTGILSDSGALSEVTGEIRRINANSSVILQSSSQSKLFPSRSFPLLQLSHRPFLLMSATSFPYQLI